VVIVSVTATGLARWQLDHVRAAGLPADGAVVVYTASVTTLEPDGSLADLVCSSCGGDPVAGRWRVLRSAAGRRTAPLAMGTRRFEAGKICAGPSPSADRI